jgi:hypothetical protein
VKQDVVRAVWQRAAARCEYCRLPKFAPPLPFQIDHVIAEKHGGRTVLDNLALACPYCNRFKGPNIAGRDPVSGETVRLFHPRRDTWSEHFAFEYARIVGRTPVGRATVEVLAMNAENLRLIRVELLREGAL